MLLPKLTENNEQRPAACAPPPCKESVGCRCCWKWMRSLAMANRAVVESPSTFSSTASSPINTKLCCLAKCSGIEPSTREAAQLWRRASMEQDLAEQSAEFAVNERWGMPNQKPLALSTSEFSSQDEGGFSSSSSSSSSGSSSPDVAPELSDLKEIPS
jgi:hypothetical protein